MSNLEEVRDDLDLQVNAMSKTEIAAFKDFEQVYRVEHPYPKLKESNLGWGFWMAMFNSVAALTLAAFRTGQAFYLSAVAKGDPFLATAESFSAVFAIEGSIVLFALQRARRQNKSDDYSSEIGLWVAFIISALAGLFQSMNLITNPDGFISNLLSGTLVVCMGLGATVIAWLGGDILGVHLVRLENSRLVANEQFEKSVHGYRANMLKAWTNSDERTAISERKVNSYRTNKRTNEQSEQNSRTVVHERSRTNGANKEEIFKLLDLALSNTGKVAGVSDVSRELAKRRNSDGSDFGFERLKGNVSETRKEWMKFRNIGVENVQSS